ncbi:transposase [Pseudomonas baetica]|uniref:transposase n=1 Tax=Pseudomonas baetica TaxID=674054 RepID=UPI003B8A9A3C
MPALFWMRMRDGCNGSAKAAAGRRSGHFRRAGARGCARIEAVAMDMNTAFDLEVRQHCPKARVVYDFPCGGQIWPGGD